MIANQYLSQPGMPSIGQTYPYPSVGIAGVVCGEDGCRFGFNREERENERVLDDGHGRDQPVRLPRQAPRTADGANKEDHEDGRLGADLRTKWSAA